MVHYNNKLDIKVIATVSHDFGLVIDPGFKKFIIN